jgi:hypothetical protein
MRVRDSGLLAELEGRGWLVPSEEIDTPTAESLGLHAPCVLRHPRLPFISYPYEWSFGALKAAALLHLDIILAGLDRDISLSDASAYNVQFDGYRPRFIDVLTFEPYVEGQAWYGYRQFCEQFLNPLLLTALFGIPYHAWYRGSLEGIAAGELASLTRWRHRFDWRVLSQVVLQARLQRARLVPIENSVEMVTRNEHDRPHIKIALRPQERQEIEVIGQRSEATERRCPRIVHEIKSFHRSEAALQSFFQPAQEFGAVTDAIKAVAAGIDDDPLSVIEIHTNLISGQQNRLAYDAGPCTGAQSDGHVPFKGRRIWVLKIPKDTLRQVQALPVSFDRDQRITRLKNPRVHHRSNRLARRIFQGIPEIGGLSISILVPAQIEPDAGAGSAGW